MAGRAMQGRKSGGPVMCRLAERTLPSLLCGSVARSKKDEIASFAAGIPTKVMVDLLRRLQGES